MATNWRELVTKEARRLKNDGMTEQAAVCLASARNLYGVCERFPVFLSVNHLHHMAGRFVRFCSDNGIEFNNEVGGWRICIERTQSATERREVWSTGRRNMVAEDIGWPLGERVMATGDL